MKVGRQAWRLWGGALLGMGLLFLFFRGVPWAALLVAFRSAHPADLAAVVGATVLVYLFRAWRYGALLAPLGRVPLVHLFSATIVGFMAGLLVPRAGEVLRPYLIARRRRGIATPAAFASIILERLLDLIVVLALFGLYRYGLPLPSVQRRGPFLELLTGGVVLAGGAALAVSLLLLGLRLRAERVLAVTDRVLSRLPSRLASPASHAVRSFSHGLAVLQAPPAHLLLIVGQSILVWMAICLGFHFNHRAFALELPFRATFLLLAPLTVGVAIPTPGMVGGFHQAYRVGLTEGFGIDAGAAAAASIAAHALTNLPILILGLVFLRGEGLTVSRVAEMTEETRTGETESPAVPAPLLPGGRS